MRFVKLMLVAQLCMLINSDALANKLINGDFELGTVASSWTSTADVSFWAQSGGTAVDNKVQLSDGTWPEESAISSLVTSSDKAVKWRWGNKGIYQEFTAEPDVETFFSVEVLNDPTSPVTGRNLRIRVSWYDASSSAISTNITIAEFNPTIHVDLGVWHFIEGSMVAPSNAATGRMELWSQYISVNTGVFYADNASVTDVSIPPDTDPPAPDPMTFMNVPQAVGATAVWMTATQASDPSGVEYYFTCTSGGGRDSGWQLGTSYIDTGLAPETTYAYTVTARDLSASRNETSPSTPPATVTTDAPNISIVNGDFEDGVTGMFGSVAIPGWNTWGVNGWHHFDSGRTIDIKAIKISATDTGISQEVSVMGGYDYSFTASIASFSDSKAVNRDGAVIIEWYDGASIIRSEAVGYYVGGLDSYDTWKSVDAVISSPDNATMLKLTLILVDFPDGGTPEGACYFDNILVNPIGSTDCALGDLNGDCQVDLNDFVIMAFDWNDIYAFADFAEMMTYWLECTMFDQAECFVSPNN